MISLVGLSSTWLLWLAIGGISTLSLLYLLRLRRRRVVVPFLPLWQKVVKQSQYQSLWQRLKRLLSWLLQVALLLFLLFALGDPRLRAELFSGRQIVVIIDTSASMQATDLDQRTSPSPGRPLRTRLDAAKEHVHKLLNQMVGEDRMMLVQMDAEVLPLTPFTTDKKLIKQQLKTLQASETTADLRRALLLAKDALQGRKRGEIYVISDAAFDERYKTLLASKAPSHARPTPSRRAITKRPIRPPDQPDTDVPRKHTRKKRRRLRRQRRRTRRRSIRRRRRTRRRRRRTRRRRRRARRKRHRRRGRRGRRRRSRRPIQRIDLPPGLKRRIDLSRFTRLSRVQRKLPRFRLLRVGKASDNVGIIALSARRLTNHPTQFAIYIALQNFGDKPVSGLLEFYVDRLIVETLQIQLKPHQRWRHILPRLTAQGQRLEARLKITQGRDLLPADNRAFAVLPKARPISVLLLSQDNLYLQAALLSDAQIVYRHLPCGSSLPTKKPFDIAIFNACVPNQPLTRGRFLLIAPPPERSLFKIQMKGKQPRYLKNPIVTEADHNHPLLRYVALRDLNISRSLAFSLQRGDRALVSSFGKPLIAVRETKQMRAVMVGFALHETDMTLRVAFPLFLRNAIQWLMRGGHPLPPTARTTGKLWRIPLSSSDKEVTLIDPKGHKSVLPVQEGIALFSGKYSGFYTLQSTRGSRLIAANLSDPAESRIKPRALKPVFTQHARQQTKQTDEIGVKILGMRIPIPRPIWLYLLFLALILFGLEWITYNRRITV